MRKEINSDIEYIRKKFSTQDIIDVIPDGDFIAVFGTSHTHGCCEKGEYTHLATDDMWANIVSRNLDIPVFNVAIPGNTNDVIVQQMIDFLSLPKEVIARCKNVIAEVRVGETGGSFSADLVRDFVVDDIAINPIITCGTDFYNIQERIVHWYETIYIQYVNPDSINMNPRHQATELTENAQINESDYVPQAAINLVESLIATHFKTNATTVNPLLTDYSNIRIMKQLFDSADIPFSWFCWDKCDYLSSDDYASCKDIYMQTSTIFDANVTELSESVTGTYELFFGYDALKNRECDCGHFDEQVNHFVADMISDYMKNEQRIK